MTCEDGAQMLDGECRFDRGKRVRPDHEITDGLRLGAIALVSAVVTAMLVIGAGRTLLPQPEAQAKDQPTLTRASLP